MLLLLLQLVEALLLLFTKAWAGKERGGDVGWRHGGGTFKLMHNCCGEGGVVIELRESLPAVPIIHMCTNLQATHE